MRGCLAIFLATFLVWLVAVFTNRLSVNPDVPIYEFLTYLALCLLALGGLFCVVVLDGRDEK